MLVSNQIIRRESRKIISLGLCVQGLHEFVSLKRSQPLNPELAEILLGVPIHDSHQHCPTSRCPRSGTSPHHWMSAMEQEFLRGSARRDTSLLSYPLPVCPRGARDHQPQDSPSSAPYQVQPTTPSPLYPIPAFTRTFTRTKTRGRVRDGGSRNTADFPTSRSWQGSAAEKPFSG